jgi:hypothetical protein
MIKDNINNFSVNHYGLFANLLKIVLYSYVLRLIDGRIFSHHFCANCPPVKLVSEPINFSIDHVLGLGEILKLSRLQKTISLFICRIMCKSIWQALLQLLELSGCIERDANVPLYTPRCSPELTLA